MEVVKQNVKVSADRKIVIELPQTAIPNQTAEVIVLFENAAPVSDKLLEMESAMSDPMFQADLAEIREDFRHVDLEEVSR
ncbi:hypothetical protein BH24ACI3_BH24ACI3_08690 [soil metagenome]